MFWKRHVARLATVAALFAAAIAAPAQNAAQAPPAPVPGSATHLMGFEDAKRDSKGKLSLAEGKLKFGASAVDVSAITDVFTGSESRQTGGKPLMLAKMAVPYGGGRVLSLFSHQKVDNITIDYADANGGLHSAVFLMPAGKAEDLKKQLVELGVHVSVPVKDASASPEAAKEKK